MSANVCNRGDDCYIIFNDCDKNSSKTLGPDCDTMFTSALSNVCYYKINKKKQVEKGYLLGDPLDKEYKSAFIESACYDEERGIYATLIRYKRGNYVSLRMAWVKME